MEVKSTKEKEVEVALPPLVLTEQGIETQDEGNLK